jgi:hypothetical protein
MSPKRFDATLNVPIDLFYEDTSRVLGLDSTTATLDLSSIVPALGYHNKWDCPRVRSEPDIIYSNRFPYKKEVIPYPSLESVKRTMRGENGVVEIRDSSDGDKTKYVCFEPVEGIGWSVIVEKGKGEVLQSELIYLIQLGVIASLLFAGAVFSLAYSRQKHKQMTVLQDSESRLQRLASQLLNAQENERRRVAHELHDSIGAFLTGIKLQIENVISQLERGAATHDSLKRVIPTVQQAIEESRRILNVSIPN